MKQNWKTQKGDEWGYEYSGLKASADLIPYAEESEDYALVIKQLYPERGKLTERRLIKFLSNTKREFEGINIVIKFQDSEIPYQPLLDSLSNKQYLKYQVNPAKDSNIQCVRKYIQAPNNVIELSVSNKKVGWFV